MKEQITLQQIYDKRLTEIEKFVAKLLDAETYNQTKKVKILKLFEILTSKEATGHTMSSMLHRNLRYFAKMELKRKHELISKLDDWKKLQELKKKVTSNA